jgi:fumarylpyruvate hydrolase
MGFTGREPPFFFMKPADAVVYVAEGETGEIAYPPGTSNFHYEIELVAAIGTGGANIKAADAMAHVWGYAVGLDMTRRDLQGEMKKQGRPWEIGKGFDESAPIGPIVPAAKAAGATDATIELKVNGTVKQTSTTAKLSFCRMPVLIRATCREQSRSSRRATPAATSRRQPRRRPAKKSSTRWPSMRRKSRASPGR